MAIRAQSAHVNGYGEWVIPQIYVEYSSNGKVISRKRLLEKIDNDPLVQEAICLEPAVGRLIDLASRERCVPGYSSLNTFYVDYKSQICNLVGWHSPHKELRTSKHYDAVYEAVYQLLPCDEFDLYPDGIMPNGMFCPSWQEKYDREYP